MTTRYEGIDQPTDEELARWCQRALPDDPRPFELLVARYQRRVFAVAYRLMGNQQEAEDQAQEAFVKIYRSITRLDDPALLTAWIYRIVTNTCLDALTARQRRPAGLPLTPPEDTLVKEPQAPLPTPEEVALQHELRECLEQTLRELEPAERAMIVLRDVDGRAYQEIAETLRLGLSAVKMRIHRARLAFQSLLNRICPDAWRAASS
jgi:RNA polymerase sigma-70 factor (ECF subfamily)